MDVTHDPLYERMMERSYATNDWRARLVIAVLENAIHELLGYRSPDYIVRSAEDFIYRDNPMFDLAVAEARSRDPRSAGIRDAIYNAPVSKRTYGGVDISKLGGADYSNIG